MRTTGCKIRALYWNLEAYIENITIFVPTFQRKANILQSVADF